MRRLFGVSNMFLTAPNYANEVEIVTMTLQKVYQTFNPV